MSQKKNVNKRTNKHNLLKLTIERRSIVIVHGQQGNRRRRRNQICLIKQMMYF